MGSLVNLYFKPIRLNFPTFKELGSYAKIDLQPGEKCEWPGPDGYLSCDLHDPAPCDYCMTGPTPDAWHQCLRGYAGLAKDVQKITYLPGNMPHCWIHSGIVSG